MPATMHAVRVHTLGGPEVLAYEEIARPEPGPGEVLLRVHAAGVNPPDWYARRGFANIPEGMRPQVPLPFTPGTDVSGVVAALGPGVTEWQVGDEVFGLLRFPSLGARAYAEYTTSPVGDLARKPESVDHLHAAGVPMAGLTAYQFLFDHIKLEPGSRVLVNGAAGGVGHFAVQLAKDAGCHVIGVASGRHEAFLKELGVAEFVDYTQKVAGEAVRDVDCVLDSVGGPQAYRLLPAIKDGGVYSPIFLGEYGEEEMARRGIEKRGRQVRSDGGQMAELARLMDEGRLRTGVDSVFPLRDAAKAHERAEHGHIQGKIVLQVAD
ncbi:NADP-dependent oxidoreductase [Nonomuraea sp. NBC_00507]|uniref:NADP-dependent oxidoreductase n=1 Tax=Nonomuraea sp. NBC_00507 TaxID=2976002 RepID=UPI002E192FD5